MFGSDTSDIGKWAGENCHFNFDGYVCQTFKGINHFFANVSPKQDTDEVTGTLPCLAEIYLVCLKNKNHI